MVRALLIGQEQLQSALMGQISGGRHVHAYLVCGAPGSGKRTLAAWWAQTLLCLQPGKQGPCGRCGCCVRFASGNHPDYTLFTADKGKNGVEDIRTLLEDLPVRPYEGRYKIIVIAQADKLTPQAQNALLKSLEEPPEYTIFILTAGNVQMILPTVRSRCEILHMQRVQPRILKTVLQERTPQTDPLRMEAACAMADGCIGKALELVGDDDLFARRERAYRQLCAVTQLKKQDVPGLLTAFKGAREENVQLLGFWLSMLRDMLCMKIGIQALENADYAAELEKNSRPFTTGQLKGMMNTVYETQKRIAGNANAGMAAERMLSELLEEMS